MLKNSRQELDQSYTFSKVKADYIPTLLESGRSIDNPCAIATF